MGPPSKATFHSTEERKHRCIRGSPNPGWSWGHEAAPSSPRAQQPQGTHQTHLLGRVGLIHAVTQLEFVGLASMQGRETWNQVDQLPGGGWWGPRRLQLVLPPHGWCARWGHGGDDVGGARRGTDGVPLPGRRGQGTVA